MDYMNPAIQNLIAPADIIIVQRNVVNKDVINAMLYWMGHGKPMAVDLDDAYHILPWSNPARNFWINKEDGEAVRQLERGLKLVGSLIAPNRLLLNDWAHVARGYYLPNYAEKDWWIDLPTRDELKKELGLEDRIIIGWGGSVSHYDSWWGSGIYEAAERLSKRYDNLLWMICGNDPRIQAYLPVPKHQKMIVPGVPPSEWPKIVRRFDIGVAPIFGSYDQRRSWIKGLEYLLAGVPWVATRGEPYSDLKGLGTLIYNSVEEWEDALENKIVNLEREQKAAEEKIEFAHQWFADSQVDKMVSVFGQIVQDFKDRHYPLPGLHMVRPKEVPSIDPEDKQPDDLSPEERQKLLNAQKVHINLLEKKMAQAPKVNGVPVMTALNYGLVQILNNEYLRTETEPSQ